MTVRERDETVTGAAGNGSRDPAAIELEIERTRAEMSDTLEAIQRKISPNYMADQAFSYFRSSAGREFLDSLMETVRRNPIPVTLLGLSLAWLAAATFVRPADAPRRWPSEPRRRPSGLRLEGEGSYSGSRQYQEETEQFVRAGRVVAAASAARAAIEGTERESLARAEAAGRAHAHGEDPLLHRTAGTSRGSTRPPATGVGDLSPATAPPLPGERPAEPRETDRQPEKPPTGTTT